MQNLGRQTLTAIAAVFLAFASIGAIVTVPPAQAAALTAELA
jgi:succinate dehydrogenase hydrophobic anchor subunit